MANLLDYWGDGLIYNQLWHIYAVGFAILLGAMVINILATYLGLSTWYSFAGKIAGQGIGKALAEESILSMIFLFIIYPGLLGVIGYYATRLLI